MVRHEHRADFRGYQRANQLVLLPEVSKFRIGRTQVPPGAAKPTWGVRPAHGRSRMIFIEPVRKYSEINIKILGTNRILGNQSQERLNILHEFLQGAVCLGEVQGSRVLHSWSAVPGKSYITPALSLRRVQLHGPGIQAGRGALVALSQYSGGMSERNINKRRWREKFLRARSKRRCA